MSHIVQLLKNRSEFINHLKADLTKNEQIIEDTTNKLNELNLTSQNIKELNKKVEHAALIPLGKKIYVNGVISHTGEYFLDKLAFPDSYSVLETLDGTIEHLELKIKKQSKLVERCLNAKEQLKERIELLEGSGDTNEEVPKEIVSDKGVATKVGDFYEILEFEN